MTRSTNKRRGFTLVELLVVTGLIVFLAALAMLTVPGIMQKNRTVDASTQVDVWLQIARARAQRDKLPRGLRLIIDTTKPAPSPATAVDQRLFVTEVQYIEAPPVFVANLNPPYSIAAGFTNGVNTAGQPNPQSPRVDFNYTVSTGPPTPTGPQPPGTIYLRQCVIRGLTLEQANQIIAASANNQQPRLWLPLLGTWHSILGSSATATVDATVPTTPASFVVSLTLDQYPDAQLGIATAYRTYHFGIYLPPRPLLGESAMQLPTNTCIDLNQGVSSPNGFNDVNSPTPKDFDILFAPSGQLAYTSSVGGAGHVFLWIREPRKILSMRPMDHGTGWGSAQFTTALEAGGEQMIVAIKSRGITGIAPVYWPTAPTESPYFLAQKAVAGP